MVAGSETDGAGKARERRGRGAETESKAGNEEKLEGERQASRKG